MATTLAEALVQVRARLDEADGLAATSNVAWLDTELRAWINEGCRDVSRRTHCLSDKATVSVTAGTAEYTAPTDALAIDAINYTPTGGSKSPVEYQHFTNTASIVYSSSTSYLPHWWSLRGTPPTLKICLYPTPSTNGSLEVLYYRVAAKLATDGSADSSNIEVPEGWEDLVYAYAEVRARRKDRDPSWQEAQAEYSEKVDSFMQIAGVWTHNTGTIFPAGRNIPWFLEY